MAERHPDAPQLSFLEDCHTIGHAGACIAAVQDFLAECVTANLVDVPRKGKVFSFNVEAAARVAAALEYQDCSQKGFESGGHASWSAGLDQAAMRGGSRQNMHPGHHHVFASVAQAAPAAAGAQVRPAQLAPPAVKHAHLAEAAAQLEGSVQGVVQRIMYVGYM